jgi:4-carboxymuconolactone decarboxylase
MEATWTQKSSSGGSRSTTRTSCDPPSARSPGVGGDLDAKTNALVRLAALLSIGAPTSSCRAAVELARAGGATDAEIVGVLVAVAPAVGGARVVGAAPRLALAIDYDVEDVAEVWDGR